jgi:hypothetical protein
MNFRTLSLLLPLATLLLNGNPLYASCAGCCQGAGIVSGATSAATAAGLPGVPGAAGAPGLAGAAGAPGLAGPPGTTGLPAGVLDYAYLYNTSAGTLQAVGPGADISFNIPSASTADQLNPIYFGQPIGGSTFSHPAANVLLVFSPGVYVARYIVTVALGAHANPTDFQLFLTFQSGIGSGGISGSDRSSGIAPGAGQLNIIGEAIFVIPANTLPSDLISGIDISVRNIGATTNIGTSPPGSVTAASLFVQKLAAL